MTTAHDNVLACTEGDDLFTELDNGPSIDRRTDVYRQLLSDGRWPGSFTTSGGGETIDWAPRSCHPYVSHVDLPGWVDANNNVIVRPRPNGEGWRAFLRYGLQIEGGHRISIVEGHDPAECMARVDHIRQLLYSWRAA